MTLTTGRAFIYTLLLAVLLVAGCRKDEQKSEPSSPVPPAPVATPGPLPTPEILDLGQGVTGEVTVKGTGAVTVGEDDIPRLKLTVSTPDGENIWDGIFEFTVGSGQGNPGLDLGVRGMRAGEKRHLAIPAALAKASTDSGPLSQGQDIVVDMELLEIVPPTEP